MRNFKWLDRLSCPSVFTQILLLRLLPHWQRDFSIFLHKELHTVAEIVKFHNTLYGQQRSFSWCLSIPHFLRRASVSLHFKDSLFWRCFLLFYPYHGSSTQTFQGLPHYTFCSSYTYKSSAVLMYCALRLGLCIPPKTRTQLTSNISSTANVADGREILPIHAYILHNYPHKKSIH